MEKPVALVTFKLPENPVEEPQLLVLINGKQAAILMEPTTEGGDWKLYSLSGYTLDHGPSLYRLARRIEERSTAKTAAEWMRPRTER